MNGIVLSPHGSSGGSRVRSQPTSTSARIVNHSEVTAFTSAAPETVPRRAACGGPARCGTCWRRPGRCSAVQDARQHGQGSSRETVRSNSRAIHVPCARTERTAVWGRRNQAVPRGLTGRSRHRGSLRSGTGSGAYSTSSTSPPRVGPASGCRERPATPGRSSRVLSSSPRVNRAPTPLPDRPLIVVPRSTGATSSAHGPRACAWRPGCGPWRRLPRPRHAPRACGVGSPRGSRPAARPGRRPR